VRFAGTPSPIDYLVIHPFKAHRHISDFHKGPLSRLPPQLVSAEGESHE